MAPPQGIARPPACPSPLLCSPPCPPVPSSAFRVNGEREARPGPPPPGTARAKHRAEKAEQREGGSRGLQAQHELGGGASVGLEVRGAAVQQCPGSSCMSSAPLKTPSGETELQRAKGGGGAGVDAAVTGIGGWGGVESFQPGGMREQHPSRAVSRARLWGAPPPGLGPVPLLSTKHRSSNVLYISSTPCAKIITSPGSSTMSSPMCWFSQAITTTACLPGMRLAT